MGRRATLWQVLLIKIHEINGSHVSSRARFLILKFEHFKYIFMNSIIINVQVKIPNKFEFNLQYYNVKFYLILIGLRAGQCQFLIYRFLIPLS